MPPTDRADDQYVDLLLTADAVVLGQFASASNTTLLVGLVDEHGRAPTLDEQSDLATLDPRRFAVYKPRAGERPLWDFRTGSLWQREVAACVVDRALGLRMVPTTVGRDDLELGVGALQRLVPHDPEEHYFALRGDDGLAGQLRRMVVLDLLLDNADRKAGHVLLERVAGDRRVRLIDHGVCFHVTPHLRTVAWDFAGEPLRRDERGLGARLAEMLEDGHPAVGALDDLLDETERERLLERAHLLARTTHFPAPADRHQYPWPLL